MPMKLMKMRLSIMFSKHLIILILKFQLAALKKCIKNRIKVRVYLRVLNCSEGIHFPSHKEL